MRHKDLLRLLDRALHVDTFLREKRIRLTETDALLRYSGGDARKLLNILELVVASEETEAVEITDRKVVDRLQEDPLAYDKDLLKHGLETAAQLGIPVQQGVYVGTTGPTFETPAEYRYMRVIGGDAVGMSTVPETIVANYLGMKVMGLSVISDLGGGEVALEVSHEEVLAAVEKTVPVLIRLVKEILERM